MCITLPVCSTSLPHFNKAWRDTVHYEGNYAPIFHCPFLKKKQHSRSTARHNKNSFSLSSRIQAQKTQTLNSSNLKPSVRRKRSLSKNPSNFPPERRLQVLCPFEAISLLVTSLRAEGGLVNVWSSIPEKIAEVGVVSCFLLTSQGETREKRE